MDSLPRFRYTTACLIAHPIENRVLVLATDQSWSLPFCDSETDEWPHWAEVVRLNHAMRQQVGLNLTTLRCLGDRYRPDAHRGYRLYVMEPHAPATTIPAAARWIDRDEFMRLALTAPEYRPWCEDWFASRDTPIRASRLVPWYAVGWLDRVTVWLEEQLPRAGVGPMTAPLEQVRVGERGCLLRVTTAREVFYFKALPPRFAHELPLLQHLTRQHSDQLPQLVAADSEQHWMLMRDFGDHLLSQSEAIEDWEQAIQQYASLQIRQIGHADYLIALGCPDLSLDTLAGAIDRIVADPSLVLTATPAGLTDREIAHLREQAPRIRARCHDLAGYNIPQTLEHGDLWAGNIALTSDGCVYFDWTDSSVSHPFFSLYPFFAGMTGHLLQLPDVRMRIRHAYLQPWTAHAPMEHLVAAFELAQQLAPLYLATLYATEVIPQMAAPWEMRHAVPYNLNILLERG